MLSIGQFSKLTQLTVKTLRFYHEQGLLVPAYIDPDTGYRYYDQGHVEIARAIVYLRSLEFPLSEIKELLHQDGETDVLAILERRQQALEVRIRQLRKSSIQLQQFISTERQARVMVKTPEGIQEKLLSPQLVGGIRMKGKYSDCGKAFARLGRSLGRFICGPPMLLHYDSEYHEDDADFEACFPLRKEKMAEGIAVHELPGGRCVSLIHRGPYDQLGRSYAQIFAYVNDQRYRPILPTHEVYLKGPGMIFKGNPKNYLTEIQIRFEGQLADNTA